VLDRARAKGFVLTHEQCGEILAKMDKDTDASTGITWDMEEGHDSHSETS